MLGKLIRNEFKCTWKIMVTIYVILIAITTFGCFALEVEDRGKVGNIIFNTFTMSYVMSIFTLFLGTFIYLCHRFFKTMYSDQGYLTHTLPVSPIANLNAKLFTSLIWLILSGVVMIISVLELEISSHGKEFFEFINTLGDVNYKMLNEACMEAFGYSFPATIGIFLLILLITCLNVFLVVFAALSLGQLSNQHKIGAAIGWGVGFYFLEQIITTVLVSYLLENKFFYKGTLDMGNMRVQEFYPHRILWTMIAIFAVYTVIDYVICTVIVKKHVNLD